MMVKKVLCIFYLVMSLEKGSAYFVPVCFVHLSRSTT